MKSAHEIIASNRYLTLATTDGRDVWIAPLAYVYDKNSRGFYFYSSRHSRHGRHIDVHPKVAISIYDSTATSENAIGLQFDAYVEILVDNDLKVFSAYYFEKSFPDPLERIKWQQPLSAFSGDAVQRFYRAVPLNLFQNDLDGMVDCRKEIDLNLL